MYQLQEEVPKALSTLGTGFGGGWKAVKDVQKHFALKKEIRDKGGQQGAFFFFSYTIFQYLYQLVLVIFSIACLVCIFGGVLKTLNVTRAPQLISLYENHSIQLVVLTILWIVISTANAFSWIVIGLLYLIPPSWLTIRQSAGWHNLTEFAKPLGHPKPLFIGSDQNIRTLADGVNKRLKASAGSKDFAEEPSSLNADERVNAALIGCLLEKESNLRGWASRDWAPFYAAISSAEDNGSRMVSPQYLKRADPDTFYTKLRAAVNEQLPEGPDLPESDSATDYLKKAIQLLKAKYECSAKNIARRWWSKKPSMRLAFIRAQQFPPLDRQSMVPQFLKLAVRWKVWPEIKPGNFIYPFAKSLAALMLEKGGLVTLDTANKFAFKDLGELYAFREAMRRTTEEAISLKEQPLAGTEPSRWEKAADIDFVLWSWSNELRRANEFKQWEIDGEGLIARKK